MEKKLIVGKYVRTKQGFIARLIKIDESKDLHTRYIFDNFISFEDFEQDTYKERVYYKTMIDLEFEYIDEISDNMIQLLRVGDYIDGTYIQEIIEKNKDCIEIMADSDYECPTTIKIDEIDNIITKELFNSINMHIHTPARKKCFENGKNI